MIFVICLSSFAVALTLGGGPRATTLELAIYQAMRDRGVSQVELARRLDCDPKDVRRLLDLMHRSRLDRLEAALRALGKRLVLEVQDAA